MRKLFIMAVLLTASIISSGQQIDTIYISELYTTHLIFSADIKYADNSNKTLILSKIVDPDRNIFAMKAREPFTTTANVSLMETNGRFHSFIIKYAQEPGRLFYEFEDTSDGRAGGSVSNVRYSDAPKLRDVIEYKKELYHLSNKIQKVTFSCDNIFAYSDITYVVVSLNNQSGVSYEANDASFVIEDNSKVKRKVEPEPITLLPTNRYGSLTAAPGENAVMGYTFEKITLAQDQVLKVYLYEKNGQRNLALTLSPRDVNLAARPK